MRTKWRSRSQLDDIISHRKIYLNHPLIQHDFNIINYKIIKEKQKEYKKRIEKLKDNENKRKYLKNGINSVCKSSKNPFDEEYLKYGNNSKKIYLNAKILEELNKIFPEIKAENKITKIRNKANEYYLKNSNIKDQRIEINDISKK